MSTTTTVTSQGVVTGQSGTPSSVQRTDTGGTLGQDAFLKLLVAQMQNQDPTSPADSNQMMSQMAQFSSVEGINKLNTQLTALNISSDFATAVSMIGHNVTWVDANGTSQSGTVSSVTPTSTGAVLQIGNTSVPTGEVQSVA
jgi:flagellar basal-body rod modification protein FlgD